MKTLVSVVGPTASGKTALSIALASHFQAPVVSVDSVQMYRGLDIGSGKISTKEMLGVKHYMLDVLNPDEQVTAAEFGRMAEDIVGNLFQTQDLVLTAGGSGFYLQALLEGLDDMPEIPEEIRKEVRKQFDDEGLHGLLVELERVDVLTFNQIDRNNPVRVCRAIEVYRACGRPISEFRRGMKGKEKPYRQLLVGIRIERELLRKRIDERVDTMLASGWLQEVKDLLEQYPPTAPALGSLGYRELVGFLQGRQSWLETVGLIKVHTHQFAKRQMTWFQRYPEIHWVEPGSESETIAWIHTQLAKHD